MLKSSPIHRDRKWGHGCQEQGDWGVSVWIGTEFKLCKVINGSDACTTVWMYLVCLKCTLKNG